MSKDKNQPIGFHPSYMQKEILDKTDSNKKERVLFLKYLSLLAEYKDVKKTTEEMFNALVVYSIFVKGESEGKALLDNLESSLSLIKSKGFDGAMQSIIDSLNEPS